MFVFPFTLSFNTNKNHSMIEHIIFEFQTISCCSKLNIKKKSVFGIKKLLEATIFWHTPGFHLCTYRQQNKKAI